MPAEKGSIWLMLLTAAEQRRRSCREEASRCPPDSLRKRQMGPSKVEVLEMLGSAGLREKLMSTGWAGSRSGTARLQELHRRRMGLKIAAERKRRWCWLRKSKILHSSAA